MNDLKVGPIYFYVSLLSLLSSSHLHLIDSQNWRIKYELSIKWVLAFDKCDLTYRMNSLSTNSSTVAKTFPLVESKEWVIKTFNKCDIIVTRFFFHSDTCQIPNSVRGDLPPLASDSPILVSCPSSIYGTLIQCMAMHGLYKSNPFTIVIKPTINWLNGFLSW